MPYFFLIKISGKDNCDVLFKSTFLQVKKKLFVIGCAGQKHLKKEYVKSPLSIKIYIIRKFDLPSENQVVWKRKPAVQMIERYLHHRYTTQCPNLRFQ